MLRAAAHAACLLLAAPAACLLLATPLTAQDPADDEAFFSEQVLPLLETRCFKCHGPDARRAKGGLRLDGRPNLLAGGSTGPAVVPGDVDASLLVVAIRWADPDLEMPPKQALPEAERLVLEQWVARGAPWPGGAAGDTGAGTAGADAAGEQPAPLPAFTREQLAHFERSVRPLLVEHCFACHGPDVERPKAGLRLGSRDDLLRGGLSGPGLVPGEPGASLVLRAVRYSDADLAMPPDGRLPAGALADLAQWIRDGAPYPGGVDGEREAHLDGEAALDIQAGRSRWAYSPVRRPPVPGDGAGHPIDAFLDARLSEAGLAPNPPAAPRALARRTYIDLIGIPPTVEQLNAFEADPRPDAHAHLVDALLARPEHGERWARHWLDVVRYAQTNGYERDTEKPFVWRYRDWVIEAINADMPYDRFLTWQLAGDELPASGDAGKLATGFYRLGTWDYEPDDARQAVFDELDDVVRTISEGMLGLTLGCARCHDHKFDPLGQADYYSMVAMVRGLTRYEEPRYATDSVTLAPLGFDETTRAKWERQRDEHTASLRAELDALRASHRQRLLAQRLAAAPEAVRVAFRAPFGRRTEAQRALLAAHPELRISDAEVSDSVPDDERRAANHLFVRVEQAQHSFPGDVAWALVASEKGPEPPPTHLLGRGLASMPGEQVPPRFVRVLCPDDAAAQPDLPSLDHDAPSSGRRRALAQWIANEQNPLTARVMVNRVWQHHFGRGIVPTPNDFGSTGLPPSHPELLDWLAAEFMHSGWSLKHLHRLILSSAAWQRSSASVGPGAEADPENALLWRQSLRRMDAEVVRDALVHVAGGLNPERGGRGFFPELSREAMAGGSRPGEGWEPADPRDQERRAVYAFLKRSMLPPVLEAFDLANPSLSVGQRVQTTTASQSLVMWNHAFVERQAARLAQTVAREAGADAPARVRRLFERVLARAPGDEERALALAHLSAQERAFADEVPVLAFAPRVPTRVEAEFLERLDGAGVLAVPDAQWTALKGPWGNGYNFTVELDTARGPAALWNAPAPGSLSHLTTELRIDEGVGLASLLLNARAQGDGFSGLELRFDPAAGSVTLVRHDAPAGDDVQTSDPAVLAMGAFPLEPEAWHGLTLHVDGDTLRVAAGADGSTGSAESSGSAGTTRAAPSAHTAGAADGPGILSYTGPELRASGSVGVRVWGGQLALRRTAVSLDRGDPPLALLPPEMPDDLAALQSLALALLNSNEFLYVE